MLSLHRAACCCGGTDKIWSASRCSTNGCQNDPCTECTPSCPATVTFCDAYRATIGLPPALDPTKCYIVSLGGCLFVVTGFTVGACSPTPTLTHNSASFYGIYAAPTPPQTCLGLCSPLVGSHLVEFVPFDGGIPCGTDFTVTVDLNGVYCNGECADDPPGAPFNICTRELGTKTFQWSLDAWPSILVSYQTKCDTAARQCAECVEVDPSGTLPNTYVANDQVVDNYCNDLSPVPDPCEDLLIPFGPACTLYGNLTLDIVFPASPPAAVPALTITRSCDCGTGGWISGSPDSGLYIEGCYFYPDPCGTTAEAFAEKINAVLGKQSATCLATYSATGTCAHIGIAQHVCPPESCDGQLTTSIGPYSWSGPFYSSGYCTATYYAQPIMAYKLTFAISALNFTFFNTDNNQCQCTGSNLGGFTAVFESNEIPIECEVPMAATDFTLTKVSGPSCIGTGAATIS